MVYRKRLFSLVELHSYWSKDDFMAAVREGILPTGDTLHSFMPRWNSPTDEELFAVWSYIQTLEPTGEHQTQ